MTRLAAELRGCHESARATVLRERFSSRCSDLRELAGMGYGQFPLVADEVSAVSRYDGHTLAAMPYEMIAEESAVAMSNNDFMAAEALCAEQDRRDEIAEADPDGLANVEHERWQVIHTDGLPSNLKTLGPITHPMVRSTGTSRKDREKRARAEYETWLETQIMQAEDVTRGNIFNARGNAKAATGRLHARQLWTNHILADHYASDELREYWHQPGQHRLTFAAFCEQYDGQLGQAGENVATNNLTTR